MCGICGIYNFDKENKVNQSILKSMTDVLSHRGPDDEGYYIKGPLALGHRRLSIIDLETAIKPAVCDNSGDFFKVQLIKRDFNPEKSDLLVSQSSICFWLSSIQSPCLSYFHSVSWTRYEPIYSPTGVLSMGILKWV